MLIEHIIVIIIVLIMFGAMIAELAHPATIAFLTLIIFFIFGLTTTDDMLQSVSNEGVMTLALLFTIASVVERTGIVDRVMSKILDKSETEKSAFLRLSTPIIGFSAFFNNTPIVVMMVPAIQKWCQDRGLYASKLLLPISYATIFGGMFTIIGTSTNLIVHGWLLARGFEGFTFFHLVPYAIIGSITGVVYLYFFGPRILPKHRTDIDTRYDESRRFLYEAILKKGCPLVGKTVLSPEFRKLKDLYLIKIVRANEIIAPIRLTDIMKEDDVLIFTGTLRTLEDIEKCKHLSIKTESDISFNTLQDGNAKLVEGVVSHNASMRHQKVKHSNFRIKYDASIIAVHRQNETIEKSIGEIRLRPGDVLLLSTGQYFEANAYKNNDFYVLTDIPKKKTLGKKQTLISMTCFVLMITFVALGLLTMFESALLCVGLYILLDLFEPEQVKKSVSFKVLLLIVSSLGIGNVIETTGTAELIANSMIKLISINFGMIGLFISIYLITNILTEVITNAAAAVIVLPIALEVAVHLDVAPNTIAVIVAIAASASFSTPIGYQTNLIVYGPGGYKFSDYLKIGLPLNFIFMVTVIFSVVLFS